MSRLGQWLTAGTLAASLVGAPAVADTTESAPRMVKLPIEGPLFMRETSSGATVIVSQDGRFVMPGRMVDRQEDHTIITSVQQAQEAFGESSVSTRSGPDKSSELTTKQGFPNTEKLLSFTVGSGPKTAYVWVDPLCPYCHSVIKMQEELGDEFTFHNLIVPLLGERSYRATEALSCMPEEQRHAAMQKNQYSDVTENCDSKSLANSQRLATVMQVESVPTIISPSRQSVTGAPQKLDQLAQFLRGKAS
jgi:thiol:disulfide interchange protein DsbC